MLSKWSMVTTLKILNVKHRSKFKFNYHNKIWKKKNDEFYYYFFDVLEESFLDLSLCSLQSDLLIDSFLWILSFKKN